MIPENIRYHHIDVEAIISVYDKEIEVVKYRGGARAEIQRLEKIRDEEITLGLRHNAQAAIDKAGDRIRKEMIAIAEAYSGRGYSGDRRYQELELRLERLSMPPLPRYYPALDGRTGLTSDWEFLKFKGYPDLLEGGTDEQHNPSK